MYEFRVPMPYLMKKNKENSWTLILAVLLLIGLFSGRALLSISSCLGFLLLITRFKEWNNKASILFAYALLILPFAISIVWSNNDVAALKSIDIKIPIIAVMAIFMMEKIREYEINWIFGVLHLGILIHCGYIVFQFFSIADIEAHYQVAKVIPVLMDKDHIRFSWLVSLVIFSTILFLPWIKWNKKMWIGCLIAEVITLHILAAKTGLVCLYTAGIIYCLQQIWVYKKMKSTSIALASAILFILVLYQLLPSLQMRVQYIMYDLSLLFQGKFVNGLSDSARWISLKAGWSIWMDHFWFGVGAGDMKAAIDQWHQHNQLQTLSEERFLPTNQFLIYALAAGFVGLLSFIAALILLLRPLFKQHQSFPLIAIILLPLITDDTLEGQYGCVIFALFIGLLYQWKFFATPSTLHTS